MKRASVAAPEAERRILDVEEADFIARACSEGQRLELTRCGRVRLALEP